MYIQFSKRQNDIIIAAASIIQNDGLMALTTRKIADKIGFTEAALYRHFKGKDVVIEGLIAFVLQNIHSEITKIDPFLNHEDKFKAILKVLFIFSDDNKYFVSILHSKILFFEPKFKSQLLNLVNSIENHLEEVIEMGQNQEVFRKDIPAGTIAKIVLGAIDSEMNNWMNKDYNYNIVEKGQLLSGQFLLLFKTKQHEE